MSTKQYIGFIALVIVMFGVLFYWFGLRPSFIKQDCYVKTKDVIAKDNVDSTAEDWDSFYKICLEAKGL